MSEVRQAIGWLIISMTLLFIPLYTKLEAIYTELKKLNEAGGKE